MPNDIQYKGATQPKPYSTATAGQQKYFMLPFFTMDYELFSLRWALPTAILIAALTGLTFFPNDLLT